MRLHACAGLAALLLMLILSACELPLAEEEERVFRVTVTVAGTVTANPNLIIEFYGDTPFTEPDGITLWTDSDIPAPGVALVTIPDSRSYTALVDYTDPTRFLYFDLTYVLATGEEISALVEYEELVPDGWSEAQILYSASDSNENADPGSGRMTRAVLLPPPP